MWAHQPSPESSQQFWVLKVTAGIAKSATAPAHMTTSPVRFSVALSETFYVRVIKNQTDDVWRSCLVSVPRYLCCCCCC